MRGDTSCGINIKDLLENVGEDSSDFKQQLKELYISDASESDIAENFKMDESKSGLNSGLTLNIPEAEKLYVLSIDKDPACSKQDRKLTEKDMDYRIKQLKPNRSAAHGKLLLLIYKVKGLLKDGANIEQLGQAKNELDHGMKSFVEAHGKYNELFKTNEDKNGLWYVNECMSWRAQFTCKAREEQEVKYDEPLK